MEKKATQKGNYSATKEDIEGLKKSECPQKSFDIFFFPTSTLLKRKKENMQVSGMSEMSEKHTTVLPLQQSRPTKKDGPQKDADSP